MPIKFRCHHCKQFLGISRAQAGKMTDCPTCGRSIRVPHLDGRIEPVQAPKLNLEDSALVSALDALAMIGHPEQEAVATDSDPDQPLAPRPVQVITPAAPAPAPRPVTLEPPLPARKVAPARPAPAPAESFSHDQELARLAAAALPPVSPRRMSSGAGLTALILVSLLMFGAGFGAGWAFKKPGATQTAEHSGDLVKNLAPVIPGQEVLTTGRAIQGRITFESMDGDSLPDKGARIIAFPQEKQGSSLLPIDGFQVTAADTDQRVARAGIRALGGDLAIADDQGNFSLDLASPGTYRLLVISNNQPPETPPDLLPSLETLLGQYFSQTARFQENLRRVSFEFAEIRYKGQSTQEWNHTFDRL